MNLPVALNGISTPALVAAAGERAGIRFLEFFASAIRNPHTRRAYARAASEFLDWCAGAGVTSIIEVQPLHVAAWIERQTQALSAPTVKQHLAAIRMLFDWLVTGQIVATNPAHAVRGPKHVVKTGKNAGARRQGVEPPARCDPDRHGARSSRPGADRHPYLFICAD